MKKIVKAVVVISMTIFSCNSHSDLSSELKFCEQKATMMRQIVVDLQNGMSVADIIRQNEGSNMKFKELVELIASSPRFTKEFLDSGRFLASCVKGG